MKEDDFDISQLDEDEREFFNKIKGLTDNAFKMGYMAGIKSILGDDEEVGEHNIKRVMVTKTGLLAFLIIVFGSTLSLGMYLGGLNG